MNILPIFLPFQGCNFKCVYCDQTIITNTVTVNFDDIQTRVNDFCRNHKSSYKEIAFFGGTFTNLEESVIEKLFQLTDPFIGDTVGIRISTRPDFIDRTQIEKMKQRGLRTVELGIQSFSNKVLSLSGRCYTSSVAKEACSIIKELNLDLGIQLMPGLPGSDIDSINESVHTTIEMKPDFVRIYPTIVLKNTGLEKMFNAGSFNPLTLQEAIEITSNITLKLEQKNITIIKTGLHSDIGLESIIAGPYHQSFGELVRIELFWKKIIANYKRGKTFVISKYDISLFRGFQKELINRIKNEFEMDKIPIIIDSDLDKNDMSFSDNQPDLFW